VALLMEVAVPPDPFRCRRSKRGEAGPLQCFRLVLPSAEKRAGPRGRSPPRRKGTDRWPLGGRHRNADRHHALHGRLELERALRTLCAVLRSILANRCGRQIRRGRPLLASSQWGRHWSVSAQSLTAAAPCSASRFAKVVARGPPTAWESVPQAPAILTLPIKSRQSAVLHT